MRPFFPILMVGAGLLTAGCQPNSASNAAPKAEKSGPMTEAQLQRLEGQLKANSSDAGLKDRVAEANYEVGYAMEMDTNLDSKVKYRGALKFYRRALELNPKHEQAAKEKKQIEDIYISMGRPIPK